MCAVCPVGGLGDCGSLPPLICGNIGVLGVPVLDIASMKSSVSRDPSRVGWPLYDASETSVIGRGGRVKRAEAEPGDS